jgi:hypothetical protein
MRLLLLLFLGFSLGAQDLFRDETIAAGITADGRARGVSVCDYNDDGRPDLFVSILDGPNHLYRNDGDFRFTEVGTNTPLAAAGASTLSLWGDLDNDGDADVVIANQREPSRLYRADGDRFTDITERAGFELTEQIQGGSLLDYDGDGLLDIYLSCLGTTNRLFRNSGNLRFEEVGADAGANITGLAMATLAFDYDLDGDADLYLVHDGHQPNTLLRNDGGYFTDVSQKSGADIVGEGMGVDAADYDGDGDYDLYVTNLFFNFLLRNEGDGTFTEIGLEAAVADLGMGWGCAWLDYDNDGSPDLYVGNESNFQIRGERLPNILYRGSGARFRPATEPTAAINSQSSTYGTAVADFDGDGRTDIFIANNGQASQLFRNVSRQTGNWLALRLEASSGNRDAIGSRVTLHLADGEKRIAEVRAGGSFASQHDRSLHFGLRAATRIDSVTVHWHRGTAITYRDFTINRSYEIHETDGALTATTETATPGFRIYPNPSRGWIQFTAPLSRIRVSDASGRTVFTHSHPLHELHLPVGLPPGIYRLGGWRDDRYSVSSFLLHPTD